MVFSIIIDLLRIKFLINHKALHCLSLSLPNWYCHCHSDILCSPLTLRMMIWWLNQNLITHLRSDSGPSGSQWLRLCIAGWDGAWPRPAWLWLNTQITWYQRRVLDSGPGHRPAIIRPHGPEHPMRLAWTLSRRRSAKCVQNRASMNTKQRMGLDNQCQFTSRESFVLIKYRILL